MPEFKKTQFSFSGGEIGPRSLGRGDIDRWQSSCEVFRNWIPLPQGGTYNRPGTEFFGYERIDVKSTEYQDFNPSMAAGSNPALMTYTAHGLVTGDIVQVQGDTQQIGNAGSFVGQQSEVVVVDADNFLLSNFDGSATLASPTRTLTLWVLERSASVVCIPFTFNTDDTYALYFSNHWMMIAKNGAMVLDSAVEIMDEWHHVAGLTLKILMSTTVPNDGTTQGTWWSGDEVYVPLDSEWPTTDPTTHDDKRYKIARIEAGPSFSINGLTNANPAVVSTVATHSHLDGDAIVIEDVVGMTLINGREFMVRNPTATTFEIEEIWGGLLDTTDTTVYGTYSSSGITHNLNTAQLFLMNSGSLVSVNDTTVTIGLRRYYRTGTPWGTDDLANLDYSQDNNTITITCPGFEPRTITRTADDVWTITEQSFLPGIEPPAALTPTAGGSNNKVKVSSVAKETGEESIAVEDWLATNTANVVTWDTVDGAFEYNVYLSRLDDPTAGLVAIATSGEVTLNTTVLGDIEKGLVDITDRPPELANPFQVRGTGLEINAITAASPAVITTTLVHNLSIGDQVEIINCTGMTDLNGRKFIVDTVPSTTTLTLKYIEQTGAGTYTTDSGTLYPLTTSDVPSAIVYHDQRLVFANTPLHPLAIYMTKSGVYTSMGVSTPIKASDAISLEIRATQSNAIKWLVSMQQLVALTEGGVYAIIGDSSGVLSPTAHTPVAQYGVGVGDVKPVRFGEAIIFVTAEGDRIFELLASSDFNSAKSYVPGDISVLAHHLFRGNTIVDMAAQFAPVPVIWACRGDGVMLGLTYIRQHAVFAWHRHDTPGDFESVCTIPEGRVTGTYLSVKRTFGTVPLRYFERLENRDFVDVQDAFFVDSGVKYDEPFVASVLPGDRATGKFTLAATHTFADDDQFDIEHKIRIATGIVPGALDGKRYVVDNKTSTSIDAVEIDGGAVVDMTTALAGEVVDEVFVAVDTRTLTLHRCTLIVDGGDHLAGQSVAILADGAPVDAQTVSAAGTLTFAQLHSRVNFGLAIEADLLTLPADAVAGPFESLHGVPLKTERASVVVDQTLGLAFGPNFDSLTPVKWRDDEPHGHPTQPFTGLRHVALGKQYGRGQIAIRQSDPLPATLLNVGTKIEGEV